MSSRLAACLLVLCGSTPVAHATSPVLDDGILTAWQFLVPPGDPEISLSWPPTGNTYLEVHHRHTADFYSVKRSIQGNPAAVYDPALSGAVDSFTFASDLRSFFQGASLGSYSVVGVAVRPVILQGGELFVSRSYLHVLVHNSSTPPGWTPRLSGTLGAPDFWRNRTEEVYPDFSAGGAPMTLALEVESSYQTSVPSTPEHLFEIDIDNVEIDAVPATGVPSLKFSPERGIVDWLGVPTVFFVDEDEVGADPGRQLALPVQLSTASAEDVHFEVLRAEPPAPGQPLRGRVRAGNLGGSFLVPADRESETYRLEAISGATTGIPTQVLFTSLNLGAERPEHECVMEFIDLLFLALARAPAFPPTPSSPAASPVAAAHLAPEAAAAPATGDAPGRLATLRSFRDQVMAASPAGRYYSALYTTYSPDLRRALLRRPTAIFDVRSSYSAWVDALATLVAGGGEATMVTTDMAADLNRILDTLADGGSPALVRAIARERARLELSQIAGVSIAALWQRVVERVAPEPCAAGGDALCLGSGRYRVEADWKTPTGAVGRAHAVALSGDSGYFWFFDPANVELLTKVVDGCGLNQRTWSYSAGLTNLEVDLFVFDTATGRGKSYRNPQATNFAPVLDSDYLECAPAPVAAPSEVAAISSTAAPAPSSVVGGCIAGPETLCLGDGRFRVEADWRTAAGASGAAHAVPLTDDTGTFWFFQPANIELVVKTIDACGLAGFENYWVFAGGTTDVEVELRVTDTLRDVSKTYRRPLGVPFAPILDSGAFATCP